MNNFELFLVSLQKWYTSRKKRPFISSVQKFSGVLQEQQIYILQSVKKVILKSHDYPLILLALSHF